MLTQYFKDFSFFGHHHFHLATNSLLNTVPPDFTVCRRHENESFFDQETSVAVVVDMRFKYI